jgi:pectin methylesterase-like acyl-CoA thioesterase
MNKKGRILTAFFVVLCFWAGGLQAARIITVDDDGPADFNTIQAAIDDSNDGDKIIVKPGVYLEYPSFCGKNITVTSTNPEDFDVITSTIIEYGAEFTGAEEPSCILTGFKINF